MASASGTGRRRLSSAQVSVLGNGAGVCFSTPESEVLSVHTRMLTAMERLADQASRNSRGVLITIDERLNLWGVGPAAGTSREAGPAGRCSGACSSTRPALPCSASSTAA